MALAAASFPYGLRVLVVDDDPTWLKILEKMLRSAPTKVGIPAFLFLASVPRLYPKAELFISAPFKHARMHA
jgi:CheY-like chemotaxis protein